MCESPSDLSIVLPAHNEAANIAPMAAALKSVMDKQGSAEIIFVDDGSSDGTLAALRAAAVDPAIRYVSFTRNFGHQAALRAGLHHARGRAVVIMDADFEHPPELLPELIAAWRSGAKVVATQRIDNATQVSAVKRFTSKLYYRLLNAIGDVTIAPGSSDYMLIDRAVVDVINRLEDQDVFVRGLVRWFGFPMTTVPFVRGKRRNGSSKFAVRQMVELAVTGVAAHSVQPLRLAVWLSLVSAAFGLLLLVYSVGSFVFYKTVVGWTSILAAIAILGAAQLLVLGIIGEYVGRILRETRKRPNYIVAETERGEMGHPGNALLTTPTQQT
jgi:glycosyltransferase involved in cell wall biosynthesis